MFAKLFQLSDLAIFILLASLAIVISIVAIFLVKRLIPIEFRYKDNSIIANTSSLINVLYGVLAGLTALYLINNNSYTTDAVQREASAVANVYRGSQYLKGPVKEEIRVEIIKYLNDVINIEWPLMQKGKHIDENGDLIIDKLYDDIHHSSYVDLNDVLIQHDMLQEVRSLYDARQQRINMSYSQLNPEIWLVVILGTILTLCINYLFGMNFYLHIFTVSAAALMASSMLFLLVSLDRPFQGEFIIEPDAFRSLLVFIEQNPPLAKIS
jgi:hypothetical protein